MSKANNREAALVYPHQLFSNNPAVQNADIVFLIEDPLFFRQYPFNKKKLVLHRASMKWYASQLDRPVQYIDFNRSSDVRPECRYRSPLPIHRTPPKNRTQADLKAFGLAAVPIYPVDPDRS